MDLHRLVADLDGHLDPQRMDDHGPNGLQVEGKREVERLVTAVTASQNAIDAAVAADADALLVHHGLFWGGPGGTRLTGWLGRRVRTLIENDVSLIAYHLPLDAHPELGNNTQLLRGLGLDPVGRFGPGGLGAYGHLEEVSSAAGIVARLAGTLGQTPRHLEGGAQGVRTIGVVSGAGQRYFEEAIRVGCDLYITGEASEFVTHIARETGTHYVWAGHHATEKCGVQALGDHLAKTHGLEVTFVDDPNPV